MESRRLDSFEGAESALDRAGRRLDLVEIFPELVPFLMEAELIEFNKITASSGEKIHLFLLGR